MTPTRGNGVPRRRAALSTASIAILVGAVVVTGGTAAALLSGALGGGGPSVPVVQAASNAGCPPTTIPATTPATSAPASAAASVPTTGNTQRALRIDGRLGLASPAARIDFQTADFSPLTTVPPVASSMSPNAGLPSGGTAVTITGSNFGSAGNPYLWAVFDFGYDSSGNDILVSVATIVQGPSTILIPGTPPVPNETTTLGSNPLVYLVTPAAYVLTTTKPWQKLPTKPPQWFPVGTFTYTLNPPTTTSTSSTTSPTATTASTTTTTSTVLFAPVIDAIDPAVGNPGGGTAVSIVGTNLNGATTVMFGPNPAVSFTVLTGGLIAAVAPPGTGTIQVVVTTPGGTTAPAQQSSFTYTGALPALRSTHGGLFGNCPQGH